MVRCGSVVHACVEKVDSVVHSMLMVGVRMWKGVFIGMCVRCGSVCS